MPSNIRAAESPECKGRRHGTINAARNHGCSCPLAVKLLTEWRATHQRYARQPAKIDSAGNCVAERHGSRLAFIAGCRCPDAVLKDEDHRAKDRGYGAKYGSEQRKALRATGGRLSRDPRNRWRGERMRVDPFTLGALLNGDRPRGTRGELMVAVMRMQGRVKVNGPEHPRPIQVGEIAAYLGIDEGVVARRQRDPQVFRKERTQRRLADSQWRAAIVAAAADRRAIRTERARREAATAHERAWERRRASIRGLGKTARTRAMAAA